MTIVKLNGNIQIMRKEKKNHTHTNKHTNRRHHRHRKMALITTPHNRSLTNKHPCMFTW